jgi:predicted ArsR family transcriptional regulator
MGDKEAKALLKELASIKKILILIASKSGATQPEIGKALGVSSRQVRNILGRD